MADTGLPPAARRALVTAAVIVIFLGLHEAAAVVAPALIALMIATALIPLQRWLTHRVGRVAGYVATLAIAITIIAGVAVLAGVAVTGFLDVMPTYASRTDDVSAQANRLLVPSGLSVSEISESVRKRAGDNVEVALGAAGLAAQGIAAFGVVMLLAAFVLADALRLPEKTSALDNLSPESVDRLRCVVDEVRDYLRITGIGGLVVGAGCTILYLALGVDLAILWGVLLAVLTFVPYLGFYIALVPPVVLISFERGLTWGLIAFAGAVLVHAAVSTILKPKLISGELNLSPFTVTFSLILWSFVFGPLGAILAVPLTLAIARMVVDVEPSLAWLSTLMRRKPDNKVVASGARHHEGA